MIVPRVVFPPAVPFTDQVTLGFELPVTVAENCAVWPTKRDALAGVMETATAGAVVAADPPPPPPQWIRTTAGRAIRAARSALENTFPIMAALTAPGSSVLRDAFETIKLSQTESRIRPVNESSSKRKAFSNYTSIFMTRGIRRERSNDLSEGAAQSLERTGLLFFRFCCGFAVGVEK